MAVSTGSVMRHCRNYFETGSYDGEITIEGGQLITPALAHGRYIAIRGSAYNDGVHQVGDELTDETFTGRVWVLSPPAAFVALVEEISAYDDKNPIGALQSESFGSYSYSRGSAGSVTGAAGWQWAFAGRLSDYQTLTIELMV